MSVDGTAVVDRLAQPAPYTTRQAIIDLLVEHAAGNLEDDVLVRTLKSLELPCGYSDVIVEAIRMMQSHQISHLAYARIDAAVTRGYWPLVQHCDGVITRRNEAGQTVRRSCGWKGRSRNGRCPKCGSDLEDLLQMSEVWVAAAEVQAEQ